MTRPCNEVAVIPRRVIPITERLTIKLPASTAARLAVVTLKTGVTAEALILDLLNDHIFNLNS